MKKPLPIWTGLVLVLLVALGVYLPCLWGEFVYDDWRFIKDNSFMQAAIDPWKVFADPNTLDRFPIQDIYRPLRTLSFQVETLWAQGSPMLHHLVSVLIHLANTFLVFIWLRRLLNLGRGEISSLSGALTGAALFALHPIQVESVAWISSRADLLVLFFLLLLLLHVTKKSVRFNWSSCIWTVVLSLLACFSKESGVLACPLILLTACCLRKYRSATFFKHAALVGLSAAVYLLIRSAVLGGLQGQVPYHGGSLGTNGIFSCYGLAYQIGLLFRGCWLSVEYPEPSGSALSLGVAGPGLIFLFAALGLLVWLRWHRAFHGLLGCLFFLAALLPTSSLIYPMRSLYNDRYLHVAMAGLALAAGALVQSFFLRSKRDRTLIALGFPLLIACLATFTSIRCLDWMEEERLWKATIAVHPGSVKARVGLSRICFNDGRTEEALTWARQAVDRARPGSSVGIDALHLAASALNRLEDKEASAAYLREALSWGIAQQGGPARDHRFLEVARNLWALEMERGSFEGALKASQTLTDLEGETPMNLLLQAQALKGLGQWPEAEQLLRRAADLDEDLPEIHFELSSLLGLTGRSQEALTEWERGVALQDGLSEKQEP